MPASVQTEAHPAGDSPVSSGRSFGRGSSGTNSEYPVLTGPPVSTRAPAINRSFVHMRRPYGRFTIIIQHKLLLLAIKCKLNAENELAIIVFFSTTLQTSGNYQRLRCNRGLRI